MAEQILTKKLVKQKNGDTCNRSNILMTTHLAQSPPKQSLHKPRQVAEKTIHRWQIFVLSIENTVEYQTLNVKRCHSYKTHLRT